MKLKLKSLEKNIRQKALELGFHQVGFCSTILPEAVGVQYQEWLEQGRHASMNYLETSRERRLDPTKLLSSCQSAIVLTVPYSCEVPGREGKIARYAWGEDYHHVIRKKCEELTQTIQTENSNFEFKICVDSSAVLERAFAQQAGLGFVGKNGLLITKDGSYFFLAVILTNLDLEDGRGGSCARPSSAGPGDHKSHPYEWNDFAECGSCTACLEHCPTHAFVEPGLLDASRCISYWTIEHRGEIPNEMKTKIGDHLFGCDVCQEVCPHNERPISIALWPQFTSQTATNLMPLEAFLNLDDTTFKACFGVSAMSRTKREGLVRNACIVSGNSHLAHLKTSLEARRQADPSPVVQETAQWALEQLKI